MSRFQFNQVYFHSSLSLSLVSKTNPFFAPAFVKSGSWRCKTVMFTLRLPPKQRKAGAEIFSERAYFGPESGQMKGQNPAVTKAMEGGGSAAKRTSRPLLGAKNSILDKSEGEQVIGIA